MKSIIDIENKINELKPLLLQKYYVNKIGYFGSFSRNEQTKSSDIDIIVSFQKPIGWEFFDLKELLETELELQVDIVSDKALKEQLREYILNSVKYI